MIRPFAFDDYRKFLSARISAMPNAGFGVMSRLAKHLRVHPTLVSQIFKATKSLTSDQAIQTAEFFSLTEAETEYFVLLVQFDRAGVETARAFYRTQLRKLARQAQDVSKRESTTARLSDEQRAIFYSDWTYSAIRQCIAIKGHDNVDSISAHLKIPAQRVKLAIEFLVNAGLCGESKKGLVVGPSSTHLESSSPWVRTHHASWRNKALQALDQDRASDLHYTSPLTLSMQDAAVVKELLIRSIENVNKVVDPSPSEAIYCFNLDWFKVGG